MRKAGKPFENIGVDFAKWGELKPTSPYNGCGMPVVVGDDGKQMYQSKAIYRMMARRMGFYPSDPEVCLVHDWIVDTYYDNFDGISGPYLMPDGDEKNEAIEKVFTKLIPATLKALNPYFENNHKFLLGDKLMMADFVVGSFYTDQVDNGANPLKEKFEKIKADFPAFVKFGEAYKAEVAKELGMREPRPF